MKKPPPTKRKPFVRIPTKKRPKQKRVPGQRRYRRIKVLRPCVIRLVFLVPIAILAFERYLGFIISLDDVRDVYYDQMGIDPWEFMGAMSEQVSQVVDLANLTYTPPTLQCPSGQRRMMSAHNPQLYGLSYRKIPNIVHQTATTRCLTRNLDRGTVKWAFRRYSYYFHDQNAVQRLVHSDYPEFPQLKLLQTASCLTPPLLFGLWKYLVLWSYGGIVAELNSYPTFFNSSTLSNDEDGFFLLEHGAETLSTLVMAVSPRHPLMYYAIQHSMSNILRMQSRGKYSLGQLVGEGALNRALGDFLRSSTTTAATTTKHWFWKREPSSTLQIGMVLEGVHGRSLRIGGQVGTETNEGIVTPMFINSKKRNEYQKIGFEYFEQNIEGSNCVGNLLASNRETTLYW